MFSDHLLRVAINAIYDELPDEMWIGLSKKPPDLPPREPTLKSGYKRVKVTKKDFFVEHNHIENRTTVKFSPAKLNWGNLKSWFLSNTSKTRDKTTIVAGELDHIVFVSPGEKIAFNPHSLIMLIGN